VTRILPILLTLPLGVAFADTIKLKSGEVLQGHVLSSDATTVTMEVQFSPTIVDQQVYNRSDIENISVESGDEIAFAKIRNLKTPDTALTPQACQSIIDKDLAPFLRQFPTSTRKADVERQITAIQADLARLKAGDIKVSGIWYDKASFEAEKYQIEAATLLEAMKQQLAAKNFAASMNSYDLMQRNYQNSLAFAEAVPTALKALASLEQQLNFEIGNLPQTKAQRQATIDRTPIESRQPIQQAIDAENAQAEATAQLAQKNNQRFFTIYAFDEKGLKSMQDATRQIEPELKAIDTAKLSRNAQLARQANNELETFQLAAAETSIEQLKTIWPEYEALGRLQQRLLASKAADKASSDKQNAPADKPH
jgi:hypothetical protein